MRDAIVFLTLYVVVLGLFRWLGGFGSAGEAIRRWSESSSAARPTAGSSS